MDKTVPLFVTSDGIVWNRTSTNTSAIVLGFSGPPLRAKKSSTYVAHDSQKVYTSTDFVTWTEMFTADYENLQSLNSLYAAGNTYAMTCQGPYYDELWTSTDDGANWHRADLNISRLNRVFPVNGSVFLMVQQSWGGWWFMVSRDSGKTWTNTTTKAPSPETEWLVNSKAVLHLAHNVTTASVSDLTTWTTQKMLVNAGATWLVYKDNFYAMDRNRTWTSNDGVTWKMYDQPYYTETARIWSVSDDSIIGTGTDGITITASAQ
jgi:hypothetical protein